MRYLLPAAAAFAGALALSPEASAQRIGYNNNFGLGVALGFPDVGLSINYFLQRNLSLQITPVLRYRSNHVGSDRASGSGYLFARADLLYYLADLAHGPVAALRFYAGPGLNTGFGLGTNKGFFLGLEAAIGITLQFQRVPIDIALEAVPVLNLIDSGGVDVTFGVGAALHARYYF